MRKNPTKILFLLLISGSLISCTNVKTNKEAEYSLLRGINYSQQGKHEKAMDEYFKSYKINPKNFILLKEMGYSYYQFGDYKKAEEYWLKALELNSKDENLIKNLVTLYYEEGNYNKSLNCMEYSYNPNNGYYQKIRALINYNKGNIQESYRIFKNIPTENFDKKTALIYIEVLQRLNNRSDLFYFLKNTYPSLRKNKEFLIKYSQILSDSFNMKRDSEKVLMEYLMENGSDDEILLQLSILYFKLGEKKKARDTFKLIKSENIFEEEYNNLKERLN